MRAVMVEVGAPRSDQMTGMSEAIEQMFVKAFVHCPAGDCEAICREARIRRLKLSTNPFCIGLPGAM